MSFDKSPPLRCPEYLAWVRSQPCVITGHYGCVAHHVVGGRCSTQKTSDYLAIPLTDAEHKRLHDGGWRTWEEMHGPQRDYSLQLIERALRDGILKPDKRAIKENA
jgi:hypothetical protein